ncbi:putative translation initiation inhibitor, yjgF family [Mesorhizobium australicum WSM2073]|uniref:Putative translation initiation inhibitor, yjgF family n=1 Tax=Mesorhizobium australicum (strain HAMBI 3006 / LMG 24608 / WSM2073) TaxID=754035 RepID=L0KH18_MESAW|nr:putative translation initiation inhibitor, yjgF family [Mesorhizobium australicum WSM2073]
MLLSNKGLYRDCRDRGKSRPGADAASVSGHVIGGGRPLPKQTFGTSHVPLSPAVRAGDFVFVSGQVPVGGDGIVVKGGITEQTEQVLANVKAALALAGCTMDDVVKTTVWLEDARDFGAFNAIYARHFPKNPPARTTVESRLMIDIKIEVEAVAYRPA